MSPFVCRLCVLLVWRLCEHLQVPPLNLRSDHWPHSCGYGTFIRHLAVTVCPWATSTIRIGCTTLRMCDQKLGRKADIFQETHGGHFLLFIKKTCVWHRSLQRIVCVGVSVRVFLCMFMELDRDCRRNVLRMYTSSSRSFFGAGLSVSVSHDVSCGETTRLVWNSPLVCVCVWRSSFCFAFLQTSMSCTSTPQYNTRHSHALLALATDTQSLRLVLSLATHSSRTLVASTRFSTRHSLALLTKHPDRSLVTSTSTLQ